MASRLIFTNRSFCFINGSPPFKPSSLSPNPHVNSCFSTSVSCKSSFGIKINLKHCLPAAASEELPAELVEEDSKFVPLDADAPTYGPPALLLLGFEVKEAAKIKQLLKELDGEFLEIIFCTEDMITGTLWEAIDTKQSNVEASKIAKSLPRICILSGLSGEEMMMFIDAFPESGLEPPVFAALVPNSADKQLKEVIEEIMGDHEMIMPMLVDRCAEVQLTDAYTEGKGWQKEDVISRSCLVTTNNNIYRVWQGVLDKPYIEYLSQAIFTESRGKSKVVYEHVCTNI